MKSKICSKCKIEKSLSEFHKDSHTNDKYQYACKECRKSASAKRKALILKSVPKGFKYCTKCKKIKSIDKFFKNCGSKDGLMCQCKTCFKKYVKINKERIYQKQKDYRKEHIADVKNYHSNYRLKNKKELKRKAKRYYTKNKDKILHQQAHYYSLNKDRIKQTVKLYRKNNKEKINIYKNKRKINDINFKIRCNLTTRVGLALKNNQKSGHTLELLGCSIEFLKKYLESQFVEGMSWSNHGVHGWHIDHIYPCASFDLSNPEEQQICFHWSNLQPLWANDNLIKGKKIEWKPQTDLI